MSMSPHERREFETLTAPLSADPDFRSATEKHIADGGFLIEGRLIVRLVRWTLGAVLILLLYGFISVDSNPWLPSILGLPLMLLVFALFTLPEKWRVSEKFHRQARRGIRRSVRETQGKRTFGLGRRPRAENPVTFKKHDDTEPPETAGV